MLRILLVYGQYFPDISGIVGRQTLRTISQRISIRVPRRAFCVARFRKTPIHTKTWHAKRRIVPSPNNSQKKYL
jgi:hypothetical protein